jgi:hypothetical protein
MSIQTDDIPYAWIFLPRNTTAQGGGDEQTHHLHRWLPKWFQSKKS